MIGVTREEIDFAPGRNVTGMTPEAFAAFVEDRVGGAGGFLGADVAKRVASTYIGVSEEEMEKTTEKARGAGEGGAGEEGAEEGGTVQGGSLAPLLPLQQLYAQIISDATIYCPTLTLADAIQAGKQQQQQQLALNSTLGGIPLPTHPSPSSSPPPLLSNSGHLYLYSTSQPPDQPDGFCPLSAFQAIPGYCPHYAFHAVDMFALFRPHWGGHPKVPVGYVETPRDVAYGDLIAARYGEFAATGAVKAWQDYGRDGTSSSSPLSPTAVAATPASGASGAAYNVVDLVTPGEEVVRGLRSTFCDLWRPYYDRLGLIN